MIALRPDLPSGVSKGPRLLEGLFVAKSINWLPKALMEVRGQLILLGESLKRLALPMGLIAVYEA